MSKPKLDNWSVQTRLGPYDPPEAGKLVLHGEVSGHPKHVDGKHVLTSELLNLDIFRREARTKSREYDLGDPDLGWLEWMKQNGHTLEDYHKPDNVDVN